MQKNIHKKIYIIGIGGIGVSAIARYYLYKGWVVFGSDKVNSELIDKLKSEGTNIIIGEDEKRINSEFEKVVYTEAIALDQTELKKAKNLGIEIKTYPEELASIVNKKNLISISGTHGKSTTTSLVSLILKNSKLSVNAVVGSILKEFDNKNTFFSKSKYFVIEACEYKRSFLRYKPTIGVITNIEIDHLDYYKDLEDYLSAFKDYIDNIKTGGFAIINGNCLNSKKLIGLRKDINYVIIKNNSFSVIPAKAGIYNTIQNTNGKIREYKIPKINMKVPGEHILFDAKIAFVVGSILGLKKEEIIKTLENYSGIWRRMEIIGKTKNGNILISDYGHHPTEIKFTLKAIRNKYKNKKILTIFQPHQYNRTIELLEGFKDSFLDTDKLIIPDIYESRDSLEDKKKMNTEILVNSINHKNKLNGDGLENTLSLIKDYDKENIGNSIIILLGAGNVDDLRYKIDTK